MRQKLTHVANDVDVKGNPTGGFVSATGIHIHWQEGPLGRGDERKEPNGAFVEGVIEAAKQRLEFFQRGPYACDENLRAIDCLDEALVMLDLRTQAREKRKVEGTHVP